MIADVETVLGSLGRKILPEILIQVHTIIVVRDDDCRAFRVEEKRQAVFDEAVADHTKAMWAILLVWRSHGREPDCCLWFRFL